MKRFFSFQNTRSPKRLVKHDGFVCKDEWVNEKEEEEKENDVNWTTVSIFLRISSVMRNHITRSGKVGDVYSTAAPSRLREGEWVDLSPALWGKNSKT